MSETTAQPLPDLPDAEPVGHNGANVAVTERCAWTGSAGLAGTALVGGILLIVVGVLGFITGAVGLADATFPAAAGVPLMVVCVVIVVACILGLTMLRIISPGHTMVVQLEAREIVDLDPERRAAMVSNLLVVLCSDSSTQPVINTGGLYS